MQLWFFVTTSAISIKVLSKWCAVLMQDSFVEDSMLGLSQLAALDPLVKLLCSAWVAEVK